MYWYIYIYGTYGLFVAHLFARLKHDTKLTKRGQRQAGAPLRFLRSSMGSFITPTHLSGSWAKSDASNTVGIKEDIKESRRKMEVFHKEIMANPMKMDDVRVPKGSPFF